MKIIKQEQKGNQAILEIEEEYVKLEPHIKKAYVEVSKDVKIPGFRQGKVPEDILKKYIREEAVIDRAVQLLISEIYPDIIETSKIKPVDYPNVEIKKLSGSTPLVFGIKVDVFPEIKLGNYKGFKLKKKDTTITDEEIEKTLEFIKKNYAKQNSIDEASLALDDDFARKVSTSSSIADLRALLRANIEIEKKNDAQASLRDEVTRKLAEEVTVDIPQAMIEREIDLMVNDLEYSLQRSRMTLQSYLSAMKKDMDKLRSEMKNAAQIRLKAKFGLDEIKQKEKLALEENELNKELQALAEHSGKTLDEYKTEMSEGTLESIRDFMLREKAIDFVVSKAKVEEVKREG